MFEKDVNEQLRHIHILISSLCHSASGGRINMQLLTFSRYVRQSSLQGHDTDTPPPSPSPSLPSLCD